MRDEIKDVKELDLDGIEYDSYGKFFTYYGEGGMRFLSQAELVDALVVLTSTDFTELVNARMKSREAVYHCVSPQATPTEYTTFVYYEGKADGIISTIPGSKAFDRALDIYVSLFDIQTRYVLWGWMDGGDSNILDAHPSYFSGVFPVPAYMRKNN